MFTLLIIGVTVVLMAGTSSLPGESPGDDGTGGEGTGRDRTQKIGLIDRILGKGKKKQSTSAKRSKKHVDRPRDGSYRSASGKNVRGPNKGISTYDALTAYRLEKGDPHALFPLMVDETTNTVYDNSGKNTKFASFCGQAVRRFCSLNAHKWNDVPPTEKIQMKNFLRTTYDVTEEMSVPVDICLSAQWRRYRGDLSAIYKSRCAEGNSRESIWADTPTKVRDGEAWQNMITYWELQSTQDYSQQMSANRSKQLMQYRGGAHSMTQYVHEASQLPVENDEDSPVNAIETFYGVHCRNGRWQNDHDEAAYEKMLQKQAATEVDEGVDELDDDTINAIVRNVLGSSTKWDTGFGRTQTQRERNTVEEARRSTQNQEAYLSLQRRLDESEARLAERDAIQAEQDIRHRQEMDAIHALLRQNFPNYTPGGGVGESSSSQRYPPNLGDP